VAFSTYGESRLESHPPSLPGNTSFILTPRKLFSVDSLPQPRFV